MSLLLRLCTTCRVSNYYCLMPSEHLGVSSGHSCTVLYKALNVCLVASINRCQFWKLIGCLSVTFSGAPGSNVANSLDGAFLGLFKGNVFAPVCHSVHRGKVSPLGQGEGCAFRSLDTYHPDHPAETHTLQSTNGWYALYYLYFRGRNKLYLVELTVLFTGMFGTMLWAP